MSDEETDIFGDPQSTVSFSDDDLNWEPDAPDQVITEDESEVADEADDNTELVAGDDAATGADASDEELPEAFRGKTTVELAQIVQDSQAFINRQAAEIGELRKMVEGINQPQYAPPSDDDIQDTSDGVIAYREAIELLDGGQIGPEVIDNIIANVRQFDPDTAAIMDRDFGMRIARAEMNAQMAPVVQQSYDIALRTATSQLNQDPDTESYREDIARIIHQPKTIEEKHLSQAFSQARTAQDIHDVLSAALRSARGSNPTKSHSYKQLLEQQKMNEQVEPGNSSQLDRDLSEEELIINSLLSPRQGENDMFANFGK